MPDCSLVNLTNTLLMNLTRKHNKLHRCFAPILGIFSLKQTREKCVVKKSYVAIKRIKLDPQHLSTQIRTFRGFSISAWNKIKGLYPLSQTQPSLQNE